MAIDDDEILLGVLGIGQGDEPVPPAETPPAPADEWAGPHPARSADHAPASLSGRDKALAVALVAGSLAVVFLSVWSGTPGPGGVGRFLEAIAYTAFLAGCLALVGGATWMIAGRDQDSGGETGRGRGEGWDRIYRVVEYPALAAAFLGVALIVSAVWWALRATFRALVGGRGAGESKPRDDRGRWDE